MSYTLSCRIVAWLVTMISYVGCALAAPQEAVQETHPLYLSGVAAQHRMEPFGMRQEERAEGPGGARYLWLNGDWQAQPWAGITFHRAAGEPWQITEEWLRNGFVRFLVNGGYDRYGSPNSEITLQMRPDCDDVDYEHLNARFIDRGRGLDEDPGTWQEVLVPLRLWTALKPGQRVNGLSLQCVGQPARSFGLADVAFVRFDHPPAWIVAAENRNVAQPWVTWPTYAQLPDVLKADRHAPRVQKGRFVGPDGRRVFVLNPYIDEDQRLDLGGNLDGTRPPDYGLFDPRKHGWIYDDLLSRESLSRLGFNSVSTSMPPPPFWNAVGYRKADTSADAHRLTETVRRTGLPFYVDTVCFPWTLGEPASKPEATVLPADAFTEGPQHWVPYRITGAGRDAWLTMWRVYARRYRDAGARVLIFELFNEPAYRDFSPAHRREFAAWLRRRHGTLDAVNATWRTQFASWEAAVTFDSESQLKETPGRFLDYDDYLSARFCDLVGDGVAAVRTILPEALVGVQPMAGYALQPRTAVWMHRLVARESVVLAPTGGGRWSPGAGASKPSASLSDYPMADAPLENDLLLALAGTKMIFDNETYLRGQTVRDTRNRLWEHVVAGLDGLTIFSWSKRGWSWWKDRDAVVTEADKFPYCALIPLARRTDSLRGIHDFAAEVHPLADRILPRPWGPAQRIGLLYSWPQARRSELEPTRPDKAAQYHAALRYGHWNIGIVPSDRALSPDGLVGYDVLVAGGIRVVEPELPARLEAFVRRGGVLVVGEEPMAEDLYGRPLRTAERLGVRFGAWLGPRETELKLRATPLASAIGGAVRRLPNLRAMEIKDGYPLIVTAGGRPVVVRRRLGRGWIYALGADLAGYPLAKVLAAILEDAAQARGKTIASSLAAWRTIEARTPEGGLTPNLLVSRRSYPDHRAVLLLNRDDYRKTVRLKVPGLRGKWRATEALSHASLTLNDGWYSVTIEARAPAVILLERN